MPVYMDPHDTVSRHQWFLFLLLSVSVIVNAFKFSRETDITLHSHCPLQRKFKRLLPMKSPSVRRINAGKETGWSETWISAIFCTNPRPTVGTCASIMYSDCLLWTQTHAKPAFSAFLNVRFMPGVNVAKECVFFWCHRC